MINKCFLYIDDYPRHANDIPFSITIDWSDGSALEQYDDLHVTRIPSFYHIYDDLEPHEIAVTITNNCGSFTKNILYTPYVPEECACSNFYDLKLNEVLLSFSGI